MKKNKRKIKIGFVYMNTGGCGRYRIINPATLLEKRDNEFDVRLFHSQITNRDLDWMDIFVMQRLGDPWAPGMVDYFQGRGGKIVYDTDDYIESIPEWNPAQRYLHKGNDRYEVIKNIMKKADLITTSTEFLRNWLIGEDDTEAYNENVKVLPNCQPMERIEREHKLCKNRWEKDADTVRILWHGSKHHEGDVGVILIPMIHILEKFDNVEFVAFGTPSRDFISTLPFNKTFFMGEVLYDWFYRTLWMINADIALCPLLDIKFNYGKSNIKVAESAVSGMVSIASDIITFRDLIVDKENGYLVKNQDVFWIAVLTDLIKHGEKRVLMQRRMEAKVRNEYNLDKKIIEWEETYRNIL